ncbi:YhcB family protein [Halomonas dongshanensis]|uniref:YhcB family protein n=1 Tax=Halomonas dongshanensis TaxID=2890835 RepID=A0ABT2EEL6_9GAMM|nr:YhcB family protein [Halomonas dongshanensis]
MEANSPILFAALGIVIGFLIGLVAYRLSSKGEREIVSLRQTVLEKDRQITEMKKAMGAHLTGVQQRLDTIRQEADEIEQQLRKEATSWKVAKPLTDTAAPEASETASSPAMPRDYADGKGGTLSEDFGLKGENAQNAAPQPPRY